MAVPSNLPALGADDSGLTGQQSYNDFSDTLQDKIEKLATGYPKLAHDPAAILSIANNLGAQNPEQVALALKWADGIAKATPTASDLLTVPKNSEPSSITTQPTQTWAVGKNAHSQTPFGAAHGAFDAVVGLGKAALGAVVRSAKTTVEVEQSPFSSGARHDLWQTGVHLAENVNPAPGNQRALYYLPTHIGAYYESLDRKHGSAYAAGNAGAALLTALAGGEALSGAKAADVGAESGVLAGAKAAQEAGGPLSDLQKTALTNEDNASRLSEVADKLATRSKTFAGARAVAKGASSVVRPVAKTFNVLAKPGTSVDANLFYLSTQAQAQENDAKLWQQTANGDVVNPDGTFVGSYMAAVDKKGKILGTVNGNNLVDPSGAVVGTVETINVKGQQVRVAVENGHITGIVQRVGGTNAVGYALQQLGASPDSMLYKVSDAVGTAYATAFLSDPLAAGGKIYAVAHSAEGFTGTLSQWWGGLGIKSSADIELTARQYPAAAKAYEFMATHDSTEILAQFKHSISPEFAKELGKAKDLPGVFSAYRQVLNDMGQMADARGILTAPKIGLWSEFKQVLKGSIGAKYGTLGEVLATDQAFDSSVLRQLAEQKIDARPDGAAFYAGGADLRYRAIWRRKLATLFQAQYQSIVVDNGIVKLDNLHIIPGDKTVIPQIQDVFREMAFPETTVKSVGDLLMASKDPNEFVNAYRQALYHAITRRASAGLARTQLDALNSVFHDWTWDQVVHIGGVDGGGKSGYYVAGPEGVRLSRVGVYDGQNEGMAAAVDDTQLGILNVPNARQLANIARTVRNIAMAASKTAKPLDTVADYNKLAAIAAHSSMTLDNARVIYREVLKGRDLNASELHQQGYMGATKQIEENYRTLKLNKILTPQEQYLHTYRFASDGLQRALDDISHANEQNVNFSGETLHNGIPLDALQGTERAYRDLLTSLNGTIKGNATWTLKDAQKFAEDAVSQRRLGADARKIETEKIAKDLLKAQQGDPYYRNNWQRTVDLLNRAENRTFVPLALLSGTWALHVSTSEILLNGFRLGWGKTFDAMIANSITKHELTSPERLFAKSGRLDPLELDAKLHQKGLRMFRDVVAGALTGIEDNLVFGMDAAERQRLLDHTVETMARHGAHLPLDVHQVQGSVFDSGSIGRNISEHYDNLDVQGRIGTLKATRGDHYVAVGPGDDGHAQGLREAFLRVGSSKIMSPLMDEIKSVTLEKGITRFTSDPEKYLKEATQSVRDYYEKGAGQLDLAKLGTEPDYTKLTAEMLKDPTAPPALEDYLLHLGAKEISNQQEHKLLMTQLETMAHENLLKMSPSERARYQRSELPLLIEGHTKEDALKDFAHVNAYSAIHHVSGYKPGTLADGTQMPVFHGSFIRQAANGGNSETVNSTRTLARELAEMGETAPVGIPTRSFDTYHTISRIASLDLIKNVSEYGHQRVLGPIVNSLSRRPIWALEYHLAMEKYEPLISAGVIGRDQAGILADVEAMKSMVKFVHNPKDKLIFERNTRVLFPFYFAQNQAYRRAFRLLGDDPGAFERYMKFCLSVTNFVSGHSMNGAIPSVMIPGSYFVGGLAGAPGIGLGGNPGSISTMVPTGSSMGVGMLGTFFRPSAGPLVDIPLKVLRSTLFQNNEIAQKFINSAIGPVASNTSIWDDLMSNSIGRNVFSTVNGGLLDNPDTSFYSAQILALQSDAHALRQQEYDRLYKQLEPSYQAQGQTTEQIVQLVGAAADQAFVAKFRNVDEQQQFIDHAHNQAMLMFTLKTALGAGSPIALSLKETFSKEPKLNDILQQTNPLTNQKYTLGEGMDRFAQLYPQNVLDLVSRTKSPYEPYPETVAALNLLQNFRPQVTKYKYASAFLVGTKNSDYSPAALQLEYSLKLRAHETPLEYLQSLLVASGDQYYYNYLTPFVASQPGNWTGDPVNGQLTYKGYSELKQMAQTYGDQSNPTWSARGSVVNPVNKYSTALNALEEMQRMVKDPSATKMFAGQKPNYIWLLKSYDTAVNLYKSAPTSHDRTVITNKWFKWCKDTAKSPEYGAQSYFITSVLRRLPSR